MGAANRFVTLAARKGAKTPGLTGPRSLDSRLAETGGRGKVIIQILFFVC